MKFSIIASCLILVTSCNFSWNINCEEGEGNIITKKFPQESFNNFTLDLSADVELIPSNRNELEITSYESFFEKLKIENRGDDLELDTKGCLKFDDKTKIKLYFNALQEVEVQGSGNVISRGTIKGSDFTISINGSGDAELDIQAQNLQAEIMGSGDIVLRGQSNELEIEINGSGNVKSTGLSAEKTTVKINGSGDAILGSCNNLNSKVNGSGNVNCQGQ